MTISRVRKVRNTTQIKPQIWAEPGYRELTSLAQWLYFTIHSHPQITWAGTLDWHPGRLAAMATDTTADDIRHAAKELTTHNWVTLDEETDEIYLNGYQTGDSHMRIPNLARAVAVAYADIHSRTIREQIRQELHQLHQAEPYSSGLGLQEIQDILTNKP
ncbi:hypothetical protein ACL1IT_01170 [Corynebacterium striatum]|uniref:hypothetical protein n=1 Tax=Corynebacterium striatum TaxID=43770 RepID=UPI000C4AB01A|nr:hypothetical protein [Corynebacterium striatum]NHX53001.1 hypothetical protein [Corynebacterium striatum]NHY37613.1 hypothetical protein [Corynebacterium striatum]PIS66171.1 hypothetical protein AZH46_00010 [Corynebacterium striatum]PIS66294.1 hypothetical protein AZH46_04195 [Corynebacterium striatum]PXY09177.1 hypothetical protein CKF53_00255 [Corynebacterium striatum]